MHTMLTRLLLPVAAFAACAACAPALHLSRPSAPEASLGNVRTVSLDVTTNAGMATNAAVTRGLFTGELPIPVPIEQVMRDTLTRRLSALGYAVCPTAPCGDGAMTVSMEESAVGTHVSTNGVVQATARLRARIKVRQNDGVESYDYSFWSNPSGNPASAPQLVQQAADNIAARFQATLLPGKEHSTLPLEDGGPLKTGVNMLLADNWDGAIGYFSELTQKQPELAGAWYDLGVAHEAKGNWGEALAAYEQAASRDRKDMYRDAVVAARRRAPEQPAQQPVQPIPVQ